MRAFNSRQRSGSQSGVTRAVCLVIAMGAVQGLPGVAGLGGAALALPGTWTQSASGGLWSNAGNWSGGIVASGNSFTASFSTLNLLADNNVLLDSSRNIGSLTFADATPSHNWFLSNNGNPSNVLTLGVISGAPPQVNVVNQTATLNLGLAGTQGFDKVGAGTLTLGGTVANTYTGTTTVSAGTLNLNKTGGALALTGNLVIGDASGAANSVAVQSFAAEQIAGSSNITVNKSGLLNLNGNNNFVASITLAGGNVSTGAGALSTNNATLTSLASPSTATISGNFNMLGSQTFAVAAGTTASGIDLDLQAAVSNGVLTKTGGGVLNLAGNNTFSSGLVIEAGMVRLANAGALNSATPNPVTFTGGSTAVLRLAGTSVTVARLSTDAVTPGAPVVENASFNPATLTVDNANDSTYAGVIRDGTGGLGELSLTKNGTGTLTFGGTAPNAYTGTTTVNTGTLALAKSSGAVAIAGNLVIGTGSGAADSAVVRLQNADQIDNSTAVTVNSTGRLDLNNLNQAVGSLTLAGGRVSTGAGVLFLSGTPVTSLTSPTTASIAGNVFLDGSAFFNVAAGATASGIDLDLQTALYNGSLTKIGTGVLNLSGNNPFTGGVSINSGVLRLDNAGALNSSSPNAVAFGASSTGTLRLNGNSVTVAGLSTVVSFPGAPVVENASGTAATLTIDSAANSTYAGVIRNGTGAGALSLVKNGTGTLTLAGADANTFTGTTTVNTGTLLLNKLVGNAAVAGNLTIGTATGTPNSAVVRNLTDEQITNGANVQVNATGRLDTNDNNEIIASLTLAGGNVTTGAGVLYVISNNVTSLASAATAVIGGNFNFAFDNMTFDVAAGTTASGIDLDLQTALYDGGLIKAGSGVLNISGNNPFTGGVNINAGVVRLNNAGALNTATPNAVSFGTASTGTLRLNGNSVTIAGLSTDATPGTPIVENASATATTLTVNTAGNGTFAGVIRNGTGAGMLSLVKNGTGTLTLAGTAANAYTGSTTVNAGTLALGKTAGLEAVRGNVAVGGSTGAANSAVVRLLAANQINDFAAITVNRTGLLDLNGFDDRVGSITLAGGNVSTGAGVVLYNTATLTSLANASTATIGGNFDMLTTVVFDTAAGTTASGIDLDLQAAVRNGSLTKSGNGVLNLSGSNTFASGLIINAGVVRMGNTGALNTATPNVVTFNTASTGTLRLAGTSVTAGGLLSSATVGTPVVENASGTPATLTINSNSNRVFAGVIRNGTGGGALSITKSGTFAQTLTGANTYTGTTTVAAGTLTVNSAATTTILTNGNGGLDVRGGKMFFDYVGGISPVTTVKFYLTSGYAGNFATGLIRSTTLPAGRTLGYGDNGTGVIIVPTLPGDANLDGAVNFNDFLVLQTNFGATGTRFDQGNFDYNNATDFNDFLLLQTNFGQSLDSPMVAATAEEVAAMTAFAAGVTPVPEPATLALIGVGGAMLRRRRR